MFKLSDLVATILFKKKEEANAKNTSQVPVEEQIYKV